MEDLKDKLVRFIRNDSAAINNQSTRQIREYKLVDNQTVIMLTLCDIDNKVAVIEGRGENWEVAVESALSLYKQSENDMSKGYKYLKLDVINTVFPVKESGPLVDIRNDQVTYNRGIDGLAFGKHLDVIFLPEEVIMFKLIKDEQIQVFNLFETIKKHLSIKYTRDYLQKIKDSLELELYKINVDTYYVDNKGVRKLYRGHPIIDEVDEDLIMEAIKLTKNNYFGKIVNKKGKFIYSYLPWENRKEKRYNILRHAGTVLSMMEIYELLPDDKLLNDAELALDFLLDKTVEFDMNSSHVAAVVEKDAIKLGGNALAIIALAKYTQVTGYLRYLPIMKKLAGYIKAVQNEEGLFTIHKQQYSTGVVMDFVSHYYPGEAILALVRLYQLDKDETWLDVAESAAQYLINVRDKEADIHTIAHDHWLLYALNELYRERSNKIYLDHSILIAKAIMRCQIKDDCDNPDWNGAYLFPWPRLESTPTAIRSEGLCAAYNLARDNGYDDEAKQMAEVIHEGIRFQLQTQVKPENVVFYKRKKLCLGAFQRGLYQYDLRIDYTQHNISSLIAYYKILSN